MNTVIIEVPRFRDITIKANDIQEAIRKLRTLSLNQTQPVKRSSIQRFKGIAKCNMTVQEEEWYQQ